MRLEIAKLPSVDLRSGREVVGRTEEPETVLIEYKDSSGDVRKLRAKWLIGADGKGGIVRKRFLESEGIKQEIGLYVISTPFTLMAALNSQSFKCDAANFNIAPPTSETHPSFPLWKLGYTSEEVDEEFWPSGFQYVNSKSALQYRNFDFEVSATTVKDPLLAVDSARDLQNSGGNKCFTSLRRALS